MVGHEEARLDFELVHVGHRHVHGQLAAARSTHLDAVDGVAVVGCLDAAYNHEAVGMPDLTRERSAPFRRRRAARQQRQLEEVAPVQRQFVHSLALDHGADDVGFGLQQHGRGLHRNDIRHLANRQLDVDRRTLANLHGQFRHFLRGKTVARNTDRVHARCYVRVGVISGCVRRDFHLRAALVVDEDDRGPWNDGPTGVSHGAGDRGTAGNALAPQGRGQEERSEQQCDR